MRRIHAEAPSLALARVLSPITVISRDAEARGRRDAIRVVAMTLLFFPPPPPPLPSPVSSLPEEISARSGVCHSLKRLIVD